MCRVNGAYLSGTPALAIVERHLSPDGLLLLIVERADDGDWSVGFDGYSWHTHGDLLAFEYGGLPDAAVRAFVNDIITSQRVVVISRLDGTFNDVWITDDPCRDEMKYAEAKETIEKRYWNGEQFAG